MSRSPASRDPVYNIAALLLMAIMLYVCFAMQYSFIRGFWAALPLALQTAFMIVGVLCVVVSLGVAVAFSRQRGEPLRKKAVRFAVAFLVSLGATITLGVIWTIFLTPSIDNALNESKVAKMQPLTQEQLASICGVTEVGASPGDLGKTLIVDADTGKIRSLQGRLPEDRRAEALEEADTVLCTTFVDEESVCEYSGDRALITIYTPHLQVRAVDWRHSVVLAETDFAGDPLRDACPEVIYSYEFWKMGEKHGTWSEDDEFWTWIMSH